jgi:glycosyltransferase involved in cell wall biosynthesis
VVPNYNHARFLSKRLESILRQSSADFEVIVLDDASSDNSCEVIASYLSDSRVRFYPNKTNSGSPFVQWNRGVQLAKAPLVWIAESDDYASPEFLSTMLPLFSSQPTVGFAYCQSWRVDRDGAILGPLLDGTEGLDAERWKTAFVNDGRSECKDYLFWKNTVPNASAVLFRRDVYLQTGGAPANMRLSGDWMTWVRMLLISDVAFVPASLNYFRQHDSSVRETTTIRMYLEEKWAVQRLIAQSCGLPQRKQRSLTGRIGDEFIDLPNLSRLGKWIVGLRIQSESETERSYALRKRGDNACLAAMTCSILQWPLGDLSRYKVWTHMLLMRLGIFADKGRPADPLK